MLATLQTIRSVHGTTFEIEGPLEEVEHTIKIISNTNKAELREHHDLGNGWSKAVLWAEP